MAILDTLTLTDNGRLKGISRESGFRHNIARTIDLQITAAKADQAGHPFVRTIMRWITNSDGIREQTTVPLRFRRWYWLDVAGTAFLELKYANKSVEIKPGKPAITVGTMDKLVPILEQIKEAVLAGELDKPLTAILSARRRISKTPEAVTGNGNGNGSKAGK